VNVKPVLQEAKSIAIKMAVNYVQLVNILKTENAVNNVRQEVILPMTELQNVFVVAVDEKPILLPPHVNSVKQDIFPRTMDNVNCVL